MQHIDNPDSTVQRPTESSRREVGSSRFSPARFLIITIGGIFLAEVAAMIFLLNFDSLPYVLQTLIDATIMILLIFPLVYYYSLRPLLLEIEKRQQAEKSLHRAHDELEMRVQERTEELRKVNSDLEEEMNVRKQVDEALQQSEERLSRAQEIARLGSWELDLLNNQLTWSDEVYRIFGLQPQEFGATYEAFLEAVHPGDRAAVDEAYSGSIRDGRDTYEIEHRIIKRTSGEIRIVHEKCEHFRDANGQIVRSVGMVHDITDRKQAEVALQKSETLLRAVLNQMPSGVAVRDAFTGGLLLSNPRAREILGDLVETTNQLSEYHGLHSNGTVYRSEEWPVLRSMATGEEVDSEEIEIERSDGTHHILSVSSAPIQDTQGQIVSGVAVFHDITEHKKAERELQQLNRTLQAHNATNQAVLRTTNEGELLQEVCKIVVEVCGHAMVWIGYAEDDEEKSVRPIASAGFDAGYLESMKITWADTDRGRGPTGTAIRTGRPRSCRNMLTDPQFAPWREQALQRGYASSMVLPLITNGRAFGAMTIYSRKPDAFSSDEQTLLTELASDLAHGIETIQLREAHERAAVTLRRFELLSEHSRDIILFTRFEDGRILEANRAAMQTYGYGHDELLQLSVQDLRASTTQDLTRDQMAQANSEGILFETIHHRKDGGVFPVEVSSQGATIGGVRTLVSILRDITERKQAEEALRSARDELELRVQERTRDLAAANQELSSEIRERLEIERQLRIQTTAMEAAANGIVITDPQGKIEWTNPALTQITGYKANELIGQNTRLFNSGNHNQDFYQEMWTTIYGGNVWQGEMTNRRKDGSLYIEEQTITPVRAHDGQISHFIAVKQDVTERNLMYAQLEESNRQLTSLSVSEHQQRKVAEILSQASIALSQTLDIQHVMETILDYIQLVLPVDAAFLILSEGNDQYRIRAIRASEEQRPLKDLLSQSIDLLNEPILKPFFDSESSTLIQDSRLLEIWNPPLELVAMRSWLGIPLISTGKTMGMVVAANLQANAFNEDQVELAEAVISQATVALQNAWLFEQVRSGRQRLQLLSRHLVEIQENERKYIARELHDETSQALTSLKLGLHAIEQTSGSEPAISGQVANLKILADEILGSLHGLAMNLRPASLDHLGLVEALTSLVQNTGERGGIVARFKMLGVDQRNRVTEEIESSVYRIVQESLTNIVRHAKATCADVILEWQADKITIIVEDDGVGMDIASSHAKGRLGLVGMQERAEMLGGNLLIDSNLNTGTTLVVEIPYAH